MLYQLSHVGSPQKPSAKVVKKTKLENKTYFFLQADAKKVLTFVKLHACPDENTFLGNRALPEHEFK